MNNYPDLNVEIKGRTVIIEGLNISFLERLKLVLTPWSGVVFHQRIHGNVNYCGKDITKLVFGEQDE